MKKSFLFLTIASGALIVGITSCNNANKTASEQIEEKVQYQCPMDCEKGKTYDKAGQCPVCGMDLEKIELSHTDDSTHHHVH